MAGPERPDERDDAARDDTPREDAAREDVAAAAEGAAPAPEMPEATAPAGEAPEAPPAGEAEDGSHREAEGAPAEAAPEPARAPSPPPPARLPPFAERPEAVEAVPARSLTARTRRDFLIFGAGAVLSALGAWWLLPGRTRARLLPQPGHDALDTLAARVGLTDARREAVLDRALTFDDDVAEALYSRNRRVRTYARSQAGYLRNNYNGRTPDPAYLADWRLRVSGLAGGASFSLSAGDLAGRFPFVEQVTRLVCVEGWSAVAWWGGFRFADFLAAFPPAPGARWAAMRSSVNLDPRGNPDPYYVSIDLETARHPQALLATHLGGRPIGVDHGAPVRLVAPMKLGLKNIKAITDIAFVAGEPRDYWAERGYSRYDGL